MGLRDCLPLLVLVTSLALSAANPAELWGVYPLDTDEVDTYFASVLSREIEDLTRLDEDLKVTFHACEVTLNNTYDACSACTATKCSVQPPEIHVKKPSFLQKAMALLVNPEVLLKKPFETVAKAVGKLTKKAGDVIKKGLTKALDWLSDDAKDAVKNVISKIGKGLGRVAKGIGKAVKGVGKVAKKIGEKAVSIAKKTAQGAAKLGKGLVRGVVNTAKKIASGVKSVVKKVGSGVANVAKKVWGGFKKLFGRRRRSLTPEEKECYAKCPSCSGVILEDPIAKIRAVCGESLIQKNATLSRTLQRVQSLSNSLDLGDIIQVKFSFSAVDSSSGISTRNLVLGHVDGETFQYETSQPLHIGGQNQPQHIPGILREFEKKWTAQLSFHNRTNGIPHYYPSIQLSYGLWKVSVKCLFSKPASTNRPHEHTHVYKTCVSNCKSLQTEANMCTAYGHGDVIQ